ncbi:hypothetical protein AZL_d04580 (plasmid) [Azospirillum sp. B510]|uniref:hypothetical protein n=1 Tax=Azospirillum sp. (strain B510) TaxID=137722 RepID=UPI0001C4CE66|nr:hypothetical protein [Azospirillum sp. B510]BAI76284.1 hypothetical protein AZL_d04580 [Azospirillum sp. B510]
MQILKALVVIMGVLIVAGFTFLGVELYKRMSDPSRGSLTGPAKAVATAPPPDSQATRPIEVTLDLPAGARIGEIAMKGNHLVFKVAVPQEPDRLYLMDPRDATVTAIVIAGKPSSSPASSLESPAAP